MNLPFPELYQQGGGKQEPIQGFRRNHENPPYSRLLRVLSPWNFKKMKGIFGNMLAN